MSMSKTEVKHPDKKVSTGTYSAGVLVDGWLYISGQGPIDLSTGRVVEGSIEDQTRLTLSHIGKVLAAGGSSLEDVVKCTCHIRDADLPEQAWLQLGGGSESGVLRAVSLAR